MNDHHHEDATMPTPPLDTTRPLDLDVPTEVHRRSPSAPAMPHVSPPGLHKHGAAAITPPAPARLSEREGWQAAGRPPAWPDPDAGSPPAVEIINRILDGGPGLPPTRLEGRRPRARRPKVLGPAPTLREVADQRERERARHERRVERLEVAQAVVKLLILLGLFALVLGAAIIGYGILAGWFTWAPTRTG